MDDFFEFSDENLSLNLSYLYRLNREGRLKAMVYARDLVSSGNYDSKK